MSAIENHGGPIDPHSPHNLYDVLNGDLAAAESTEYCGLHLMSQGNGVVHVQPDGYAGTLSQLDAAEYDDVLELVAELNGLLFEWQSLEEHGSLEERVERAGKLMTSDPAKAAAERELYLHVPTDVDEPAITGGDRNRQTQTN